MNYLRRALGFDNAEFVFLERVMISARQSYHWAVAPLVLWFDNSADGWFTLVSKFRSFLIFFFLFQAIQLLCLSRSFVFQEWLSLVCLICLLACRFLALSFSGGNNEIAAFLRSVFRADGERQAAGWWGHRSLLFPFDQESASSLSHDGALLSIGMVFYQTSRPLSSWPEPWDFGPEMVVSTSTAHTRCSPATIYRWAHCISNRVFIQGSYNKASLHAWRQIVTHGS